MLTLSLGINMDRFRGNDAIFKHRPQLLKCDGYMLKISLVTNRDPRFRGDDSVSIRKGQLFKFEQYSII